MNFKSVAKLMQGSLIASIRSTTVRQRISRKCYVAVDRHIVVTEDVQN